MTLMQHLKHFWYSKLDPNVHWISHIDFLECCFKTACEKTITTNDKKEPNFLKRARKDQPWRVTCKECYKERTGR